MDHGASIHSQVAPQKGDIVITKTRVSAFSTTNLASILRLYGRQRILILRLHIKFEYNGKLIGGVIGRLSTQQRGW